MRTLTLRVWRRHAVDDFGKTIMQTLSTGQLIELHRYGWEIDGVPFDSAVSAICGSLMAAICGLACVASAISFAESVSKIEVPE